MSGVITSLLGILILFPFIGTLSFLIFMRAQGQAPATVIGRAADLTTPLLFISVYIVSHTLFGDGVGVYIAGIAIIVAIIYAVTERLKVKEFRIVRLLRKLWRLYFLILSISYLLLLIVGAVVKVIEYMK